MKGLLVQDVVHKVNLHLTAVMGDSNPWDELKEVRLSIPCVNKLCTHVSE